MGCSFHSPRNKLVIHRWIFWNFLLGPVGNLLTNENFVWNRQGNQLLESLRNSMQWNPYWKALRFSYDYTIHPIFFLVKYFIPDMKHEMGVLFLFIFAFFFSTCHWIIRRLASVLEFQCSGFLHTIKNCRSRSSAWFASRNKVISNNNDRRWWRRMVEGLQCSGFLHIIKLRFAILSLVCLETKLFPTTTHSVRGKWFVLKALLFFRETVFQLNSIVHSVNKWVKLKIIKKSLENKL